MPSRQSTEQLFGQSQLDIGDLDSLPLSDGAPSRRERRRSMKQPSKASSKDAFFKAANNPAGTQTQCFFQAKYYGPVPEIAVDSDSPDLANVLDIMTAKKAENKVLRCYLYFTENGVSINDKKSNNRIAAWATKNMASCATIVHPNSKSRRIGLLKIRDPKTNKLTWHLFKYYFYKKDNMSDCFRFIVDCSLRDIGRAYAERRSLGTIEPLVSSPPPTRVSAWEAPPVPPAYDSHVQMDSKSTPTRRSLFSPTGKSIDNSVDVDGGDQVTQTPSPPNWSGSYANSFDGYMEVTHS